MWNKAQLEPEFLPFDLQGQREEKEHPNQGQMGGAQSGSQVRLCQPGNT